jgi:hypothetical protein
MWRISPCCTSPCYTPLTYLASSSCDRNCPPQSQVVCKLTLLSPIVPLYPSPWNPDPPWVFPGLNVHPIRAVSQTHFPVYDTIPLCTVILYTAYKISAFLTLLRSKIWQFTHYTLPFTNGALKVYFTNLLSCCYVNLKTIFKCYSYNIIFCPHLNRERGWLRYTVASQ